MLGLLADRILCITREKNRAAFSQTSLSAILYLHDGKLNGAAIQGKISIRSALK